MENTKPIKLIRLTTGEDLISYCDFFYDNKGNNTTITLTRPLVYWLDDDDNLSMMNYIPTLMSDDVEITIPKSLVVCLMNPKIDIAEYYVNIIESDISDSITALDWITKAANEGQIRMGNIVS